MLHWNPSSQVGGTGLELCTAIYILYRMYSMTVLVQCFQVDCPLLSWSTLDLFCFDAWSQLYTTSSLCACCGCGSQTRQWFIYYRAMNLLIIAFQLGIFVWNPTLLVTLSGYKSQALGCGNHYTRSHFPWRYGVVSKKVKFLEGHLWACKFYSHNRSMHEPESQITIL